MGEVTVVPGQVAVMFNGEVLFLTPTQFVVLFSMMRRPGYIMTREQIIDILYAEYKEVDLHIVDTHVKRIRRALLGIGLFGVIETVPGVGFKINPKACYRRKWAPDDAQAASNDSSHPAASTEGPQRGA